MACLRSEEVLNSYQGSGRAVILAVCGMERKVDEVTRICTCIACVEWEGYVSHMA